MRFDRRTFGQALVGAISYPISGCAIPDKQRDKIAEACQETRNDIVRIDMHCHLMNHKDVNGVAYLNRRELNLDEKYQLFEPSAGLLTRFGLNFINLATHTASAETRHLEDQHDWSAKAFCEHATDEQPGLFFQNDRDESEEAFGHGRITGFASNRARNASLMMAQFPQVDIFMPAMVDLYDGPAATTTPPAEQARFYKALNVATHGRFLPLISFNPERQWYEDNKFENRWDSPLALVRHCIEKWGFVGVKLHPSSGFNPIDNQKYGCPNTALQLSDELERGQWLFYNECMERLFDLCVELDVPILTHGSDSLAANASCMRNGDDPTKWTNAPSHWARVVQGRDGLRICLAHFASRFHDQTKTYQRSAIPVEYDQDGNLQPSPWLQAALDAMQEPSGSGIYLDLSYMVNLALSQAARQGWHGAASETGRLFPELRKEYTGKYAEAFEEFLVRHDWLRERVMYGSDWHMPGVSLVGNEDEYLRLIEAVLPADQDAAFNKAVMGMNAVDFFGLREGRQTRARLVDFYAENEVPLAEVAWLDRVDVQAT